jgi:hypothetical protein
MVAWIMAACCAAYCAASPAFGAKEGEFIPMEIKNPCVQRALDEELRNALERVATPLAPASTVVWTVAGGEEYAKIIEEFGRMIQLAFAYSELPPPTLFIVALDEHVAQLACENDIRTMIWHEPQQAYSRVADAKFLVSIALCEMGFDFLFVEMDVWLKGIPPSSGADIAVASHQDNPGQANIGYYEVKANLMTQLFFEAAFKTLSSTKVQPFFNVSLEGQQHKRHRFFDQDAFQYCLTGYRRTDPEFATSIVAQGYTACTDFPHWAEFGAITIESGETKARGKMTYVLLGPNTIACGNPPVIIPGITFGIHTLTGAPLSSPVPKFAIAKELGWWTGYDGYYDDAAAKYLMLPGNVIQGTNPDFFGQIMFVRQNKEKPKCGCLTTTASGKRRNCVCMHFLSGPDLAFVQSVVGLLLVVAQRLKRILILPKLIGKSGNVIHLLEHVDAESLTAVTSAMGISWRESSFPSNLKTRIQLKDCTSIKVATDALSLSHVTFKPSSPSVWIPTGYPATIGEAFSTSQSPADLSALSSFEGIAAGQLVLADIVYDQSRTSWPFGDDPAVTDVVGQLKWCPQLAMLPSLSGKHFRYYERVPTTLDHICSRNAAADALKIRGG